MLMKFGSNRNLDTKAGGYTCLSDVAFIIQSVIISLQPGRNKQEKPFFKYGGCTDECVCVCICVGWDGCRIAF